MGCEVCIGAVTPSVGVGSSEMRAARQCNRQQVILAVQRLGSAIHERCQISCVEVSFRSWQPLRRGGSRRASLTRRVAGR